MPDIKEKLVEEITTERAAIWFENRAKNTPMPAARSMFELAGAALREKANGVTIQEWISVEERLPGVPLGWSENPEPVFFIVKGQDKVEAGYYGENGMWRDKYFRTYRNGRDGYDASDVLCWMWQSALPEPPKGE